MLLLAPILLALAPASDPVVAWAGSEAIHASDVRARAALAPGKDPHELVRQLADEALLTREGYREGLAAAPEVETEVATERRRAAAARLLERDLYPAAKLHDQDLLVLYHAAADSVRLDLVVLATEDAASAARARLARGAKLDEEATSSVDPESRAAHGALGERQRKDLQPALAEAAFAAPLKTWFGPVRLELGWAVGRVTERTVGDESGFAARRDELRRFAESQTRQRVERHFLDQLRRTAGVKLDEEFLAGTAGRADGSAAELAHVVARVGERAVTYGDVSRELHRVFGQASGHAAGRSVKTELAWALVDQMLLEDAALARGLGDDPEVKAAVARAERDAVGQALLAKVAERAGRPSEADLERWYAGHRASFAVAAQHHCAHIVVASEGLAAELHRRLDRGESFATLARAFSVDTATAADGGLIGDVGDDRIAALAGSMGEPALAAAMRDGRPGEIRGPVRSRMGWHLVRCDGVTPARERPLSEVRDEVARSVARERRESAVQERVATLRSGAATKIDERALARALDQR